jgi:hypothetical protein
MNAKILLLPFLAACGYPLLSGCQSTSSPEDSRTSWLSDCAMEADCNDGLSCVCGLCTTRCEAEADCNQAEGAVCGAGESVSNSSCGGGEQTARLCTLACETAAECPFELSCNSGLCSVSALEEVPKLDAAPPGDPDAGGTGLNASDDTATDLTSSEPTPRDAGRDAGEGSESTSTVDSLDAGREAGVNPPLPPIRPSLDAGREAGAVPLPPPPDLDSGPDASINPGPTPIPPVSLPDSGGGALISCGTEFLEAGAAAFCIPACGDASPSELCVVMEERATDLAYFDGALWIADWGSQDELGNHRADGTLIKWSQPAGAEVVIDGQLGTSAIAVAEGGLTWTTEQSPDGFYGDLWQSDLDGSNAERRLQERQFDTLAQNGVGLAVQADLVYFSEDGGNLVVLNPDNTSWTVTQQNLSRLAVGAGTQFFYTVGSDGIQVAEDESSTSRISPDAATSLLVYEDLLYYGTISAIRSVPTAGGRPLNVNNTVSYAKLWAAAGDWLYWTTSSGVSRLRLSASTSVESLLDTSRFSVTDLVLGEDALYILRDGAVLRLPLPVTD